MRANICGVLALIAVCGFPGYGQSAAAVQGSQPPKIPFTEEFESTIEMTLPDGTATTEKSHGVRAADSEGRTSLSGTSSAPVDTDHTAPQTLPSPSAGEIQDPIARTLTFWRSLGAVATVRKLTPPEQEIPSSSPDCAVLYVTRENSTSEPSNDMADSDPEKIAAGRILFYSKKRSAPSPIPILAPVPVPVSEPAAEPVREHEPEKRAFESVEEDLGTDTILGIAVHGKRVKRIHPEGKTGPNGPTWDSTETWTATEDIPGDPVLRSVYIDPVAGRTTTEIVTLQFGEPDSTLFQPPAGYKIVNEQMRSAPCPSTDAARQ